MCIHRRRVPHQSQHLMHRKKKVHPEDLTRNHRDQHQSQDQELVSDLLFLLSVPLLPFIYTITLSYIFGVDILKHFNCHSSFLREHIFVGFDKFPSLVYWCMIYP